jgi:hypothetical protein
MCITRISMVVNNTIICMYNCVTYTFTQLYSYILCVVILLVLVVGINKYQCMYVCMYCVIQDSNKIQIGSTSLLSCMSSNPQL